MDTTEQSLPILSLCSGMRGLERGIERAFVRLNWPSPKSIAYVEIEAFVSWNLVKAMEKGLLDPAPIWSNLKTFNWSMLRGKVFCITGGYPCQPFSVAGKQKGTEDPRHLWPYIKNGIEAIRPVCCFFENVRNHLNIGYEQVKTELEELGYRVEQGIYSAEEVGAPHKRDRLFILAILGDSNSDGNSEIKGNASEMLEVSEIERTEISATLPIGTSSELANGNSKGLPILVCEEFRSVQQKERASERGKPGGIYAATKWPSRPGEKQYPWEQPRTKSRVGFTVNGYNFREDLLRMAGNGVVEQTAELAFLDLLRKQGII